MTFRALHVALCSNKGLTLETSASLNLLSWRLILSPLIYQLRVDNQLSALLARRRSTTVSLETNHFVL